MLHKNQTTVKVSKRKKREDKTQTLLQCSNHICLMHVLVLPSQSPYQSPHTLWWEPVSGLRAGWLGRTGGRGWYQWPQKPVKRKRERERERGRVSVGCVYILSETCISIASLYDTTFKFHTQCKCQCNNFILFNMMY